LIAEVAELVEPAEMGRPLVRRVGDCLSILLLLRDLGAMISGARWQ
jgi:hypothetical protein